MDDPVVPTGQSKNRPHPPLSRTASRSSASSSKTRMTSQSAHSNPSSSRSLHPSPRPAAASHFAHAHRFHHSVCHDPSPDEKPRLNLSLDTKSDFRKSLPPVSSFLQERLQKGRRAESERTSSRLSGDTSGSSMDQGTVQSSPGLNDTDHGRPGTSGGGESSKKVAMGVNEMERMVSVLHKQNFDLKLELYHGREKQAEMEDRIKELERDKAERDEVNDQLVAELEKRDKAVHEAVNMIVTLEAQRDQLLKERGMVQPFETDGFSLSRAQTPSTFVVPGRSTPKPLPAELPRLGDAKVINRMPSFLTELSVQTENLRDVYLGGPGSLLGFPGSSDDGHTPGQDSKGIRSPSLSVLSESSFMSVYGRKAPPERSVDGPSENEETVKINGRRLFPLPTSQTAPTRLGQWQVSNSPIPFNKIREAMNGGSPLQRLETLDRAFTYVPDSRPSSPQSKRYMHDSRSSSREREPQVHPRNPKTKQEKRDALKKVLTNGVPRPDLEHAHALPPTPDTISTSTLRHYKRSSDTLPKEIDLMRNESQIAGSEAHSGSDGTASSSGVPPASQPASTTAFESRKNLTGTNGHSVPSFALPHPSRPLSADATTISHRRPLSDWESDDSFDNFDDDIWMHEGADAGQSKDLDPTMSASQGGGKRNRGRASPDLFSFPTTSNGWATEKMFRPHQNESLGYKLGAPTPLAETLDALGDSLPTPLYGSGLSSPVLAGVAAPPPPPNRRSSLQATMGSGSVIVGSGTVGTSPARTSASHGKLRKSPARSSRTRSNSIDAQPPSQYELGVQQDRAYTMPARETQIGRPPPTPQESAASTQRQQQLAVPKQRHYPPTASQPPRSRGLNLFRRSTGSAEPRKYQLEVSAPAPITPFEVAPQMVGIPSWGRRTTRGDDDRTGATPPPIMRKPPDPQWAKMEERGGASLEAPDSGGGAPVGIIPGTAPTAISPQKQQKRTGTRGSDSGGASVTATVASSTNKKGGKRKWLGLGRVASLRNHRTS